MNGLEVVRRYAERERATRTLLELAIVSAREQGASWREIATASGRSVEGVRKIARTAREGDKSA